MSSHRLSIESDRWAKPTAIPLEQRKCRKCKVLEDCHEVLVTGVTNLCTQQHTLLDEVMQMDKVCHNQYYKIRSCL
jgi:hypothetical protein